MECHDCEEREALYRLSATTLQGEVLSLVNVCRDCAEHRTFKGELGALPLTDRTTLQR